ncbi:peptidylprolyl isomerase [Desulfoscipio geothermicus]|uniref:Peptidyl-prolyl cis-trans isomerase n=1 Tax=Desulfoscipio geothermicus DSM 3669 TaxID=1121426 RepID=A0A1I6CRE2_9FIRM|nr:peptidylprolyl isomerase [Desulfoscipio geothermicus]SFQ95785.1 peptidyl-prolyl cis-trans isomerase B (cyclophilin B) [Desulfoscipio geothermicus DSM 3669]
MATRKILISTGKGNISLEVYPEKMPVTVENFLKLTNDGFYNGLTFHRVEHWVVQGGDPRGNGTGGPGWTIKLETHPDLKNVRGAVAMARAAHPDSAGSQFYILKKDASWLDGQYAVFGRVTEGMDVVDNLEIGDKMDKVQAVD